MDLDKLRTFFPWPAEKPARDFDPEGWMHPDTAALLDKAIPGARIAVEVGTWMGMSARYMLDKNPDLVLICIDTWLGSYEHHVSGFQARFPILYDQFVANCWDYRDRLIPVRLDSMNGLKLIEPIKPDFVYLDGGHAYEVVGPDLKLISKQWPTTPVVLDDYAWEGVARAVAESGRTITSQSYACSVV